MKVSVVVPAYNAERTLGDCLSALKRQDLSNGDYEVIVVEDGSADSSANVAQSFDVILLRARSRRGAAAARNVGFRAAEGKWVAFTDADCIPSRGWLRNLLSAVNKFKGDQKVLGVAGRTLGFQSNSPPARFVDLTGGLDAERHLKHPNFPFAPLGNVMYLRRALEVVGGADERYCSYEACDLHYRLLQEYGGVLCFEPRAVVFHRHRADWKSYWNQQLWYGRGVGQFYLHHRVKWSVWRELRAWGDVSGLAIRACLPGGDDRGLIRRGNFVKHLAQRLGFMCSYWNWAERKRW
jgi:glycosyltransferase involved in cell wall biosynthesis